MLTLLIVLVVITAWNSMAIIALYKRGMQGQDGRKSSVETFLGVGDAVPPSMSGSTISGEHRRARVGEGTWLIVVASSACSACHRALQATYAAAADLPVTVMPVLSSSDRPDDLTTGQAGWMRSAAPTLLGELVFLQGNQWKVFGADGTPTALLINAGIVVDIGVGLATEDLVRDFLERSIPGRTRVG